MAVVTVKLTVDQANAVRNLIDNFKVEAVKRVQEDEALNHSSKSEAIYRLDRDLKAAREELR